MFKINRKMPRGVIVSTTEKGIIRNEKLMKHCGDFNKHTHLFVSKDGMRILYKECEGYKIEIKNSKETSVVEFVIKDNDNNVLVNAASDCYQEDIIIDGFCNSLTLDEKERPDFENNQGQEYKVFKLKK